MVDPIRGASSLGRHLKKRTSQNTDASIFRHGGELKAKNADRSTAAAALLSFALVLLDWSLVMAQTLEIRKDPGLGDLTLKATQGRFDAFVFSNRDLSHSKRKDFQLSNVASDRQMAQRESGDPGMPSR